MRGQRHHNYSHMTISKSLFLPFVQNVFFLAFLISCMKFGHDILCAKQTELENSLENLEKVLVHAEVTCRYNIRSLACFDSHASDRNSSLQQIIRYQCKFTKFEQKIDKLNKESERGEMKEFSLWNVQKMGVCGRCFGACLQSVFPVKLYQKSFDSSF